MVFWSSVVLTGNQTHAFPYRSPLQFWSSVVLTGNQTDAATIALLFRFGAVSF